MLGREQFTKCGLDTLSNDHLRALQDAVASLVKRNTPSPNLWRAALQKMPSLGWEEVSIEWSTLDGKDWLVVQGLISKHATKDIPFGISPIGLRAGRYWGKRALFGGLNAILDSSGSEHSFLFADWVEL